MRLKLNGKQMGPTHKIVISALKGKKVEIDLLNRNFITTDTIQLDAEYITIETTEDEEDEQYQHPHHSEMGQAY